MTDTTEPSLIRNFSVIAHIDHGKSTLSDRLIERCGALEAREMTAQVLDSMDLERERGITIKAQTARLAYRAADGRDYVLNLMDTPGHVDFSYEVRRCLSACEGSLLLVDASQGVEAQTLANAWLAVEASHEIIVVLNKIDLPAADPEKTCAQIAGVIGIDARDAIHASAKSGLGIDDILEAIVRQIPPPRGSSTLPLRALLIDSWYDPYLGVMVLFRIIDGTIRKGMRIRLMASNRAYSIDRLGVFTPRRTGAEQLGPGEIGFFTASIKEVSDTSIGDTITLERGGTTTPLPGFRPSVPVVFCSLFPADTGDFGNLADSLARLRLNDASFHAEPETSEALGPGFRCGFLGMLHLEIIQERLEREFGLDLIMTAPSVVYHVHLGDGSSISLHNPSDMPDPARIQGIDEPWIRATILLPDDCIGAVLGLCESRRGEQVDMTFSGSRAVLVYRLPLNEVVFDFHDRLKSVSRGYASLDHVHDGWHPGDLVRLSILVNGEPVDALAMIVHRSRAESRGRQICERLKELIPRQMFRIAIQASLGGRVIARETISALRKDVLAKCYGGDITRKRKLLEKQREGKKRMRQVGNAEIPHAAFLAALRMDRDR